jgi:hypothetical protein
VVRFQLPPPEGDAVRFPLPDGEDDDWPDALRKRTVAKPANTLIARRD